MSTETRCRRAARSAAGVLVVYNCLMFSAPAFADVRLPALFSDHAVLQRDRPVPVWGWADAGEKIVVSIPNQEHSAVADGNGRWQVVLNPMSAGGAFTMNIVGKNRLSINDIQVGDVWLCSGQSNMQWSVAEARDADIEIPAAKFPELRLITIETPGSQTPLEDFPGRWQECNPKTIEQFSAVGYYFGRDMMQVMKVPIGLIDNSWGGSACEAWIRRDLLEGNPLYQPMLDRSDQAAAKFDEKKAQADLARRLAEWQARADQAHRRGEPDPPNKPDLDNPVTGQLRVANLYNGRIKPLMPYAIRGVIWYQGETNVERAYQYRELFPLMVKNWRDDWGQGDFPFYWVQLANYLPERNQPGDSAWAELREAQTMTLERLPHTGQAVTIDLGEADNIHPKDKQTVGRRLARQALAKTFHRQIAHESPRYKSMYKQGHSILIRFRDVNGQLRTIDNEPVTGFAIASANRKWVWADATIVGAGEVEVSSDAVRDPFAVRYAWADNPQCNLIDSAGMPVTPFRTDQWPGVTADAK
jgi:sialate O-acetylesterase